jgi:excisionase family DNA binding protein
MRKGWRMAGNKKAERLFTRPIDLAAMLDVTPGTIYMWIDEKRIQAKHFGNTVRIPNDEVERILRDGIRTKK